MHPSLWIALRHFLVKDAAASRHPLDIARPEAAAISEAVAVFHASRQYVGDRFNPAMRMPWEPRQVLIGVVVAKVIEEKEWVVIGGIAKANRPAQFDPGALEGGLGHRNALNGSDGHGAAPFSDGIFEVYDAHNGVSVPYWRPD